jgi:hypothetical protein
MMVAAGKEIVMRKTMIVVMVASWISLGMVMPDGKDFKSMEMRCTRRKLRQLQSQIEDLMVKIRPGA